MKGQGQEKDHYLYFNLNTKERDSALRYLLGVILKVRQKGVVPPNQDFDEDVNIYLAHLLFAISLPEYHEMASPYLSNETSDLIRWVQDAEDTTVRYFIYKVNADHLLIHTTIFKDVGAKSRQRVFQRSSNHFRELTKLYYDQAAAYHRRIYRKKTAVGDILEKISSHIDVYQELLTQVRRDYFNFVHSFRDQAFGHFMHQLKNFEKDECLKIRMDEFLDCYGQWLGSQKIGDKKRVRSLALELMQLDPNFKFDLDRLDGSDRYLDDRKCA